MTFVQHLDVLLGEVAVAKRLGVRGEHAFVSLRGAARAPPVWDLGPVGLRGGVYERAVVFRRASTLRPRKSSQVRNYSPGNMEQAPSSGHEASPQSGLGVGCKRCSSSKKSCVG